MHNPISRYPWTVAILVASFVVFITWLFALGRIPYCECGIGLLTLEAAGPTTSQHLFDPYTLSHILHGVIFYPLLFYIARRLPLRTRFVIAVLIEMAWEILENSPFIIDRYRTATAARGYEGDSILNSLGDVLSMLLGYELARQLPVWASVAFFLLIEFAMLALFRDNLTLNVIMLLYPIEAIKEWQLSM